MIRVYYRTGRRAIRAPLLPRGPQAGTKQPASFEEKLGSFRKKRRGPFLRFGLGGLGRRTPGPPPFSSMNSTSATPRLPTLGRHGSAGHNFQPIEIKVVLQETGMPPFWPLSGSGPFPWWSFLKTYPRASAIGVDEFDPSSLQRPLNCFDGPFL